ncbi:hybrid sensor histidine kinase/response regulator [Hirschia litorea]|uniref:histidine kinase n=1 Tax=Hirschia litorea TaxID=1199156 RepID=A0ABW2IIQ0_9PROT
MLPLRRYEQKNEANSTKRSYKPRVLIVDDELPVLLTLKRAMRKKYDIVVAITAEQALKSLEGQAQFAVILSDLHMPGTDGITFLKEAKRLSPSTARIMLTGSADNSITLQAVNECQIFRFLQKPCSADQIGEAIELGVQSYETMRAPHNEAANILSKFQDELRTPLVQMLSDAKLIKQDLPTNVKSVEYVSQILENGHSILEKAETILDLVAIHTSEYSINLSSFDTHSLIKSAIDPFRKLALAKGLHLEIDMPTTPIDIHSDERLLNRALSGLISNAVKFAPIDSVIKLNIDKSGEDNSHIKFEIIDQGLGFDADSANLALQDLNHSFGNNNTSPQTGLGLPLASTTAEFLGGYLELNSQPNKGTTASLFIPTRRDETSVDS